MKLSDIGDLVEVTKGGNIAAHDYKINDTGAIFHTMVTMQYSNPIQAIDELLNNGFDAWVEAGRNGPPFRITLPSKFNPTLTIRDYGTGVSPEKFEGFMMLGLSTKNHSNQLDGGFGIGRFTALLIAEAPKGKVSAFGLNNYCDGKVASYAITWDMNSTASRPQLHILQDWMDTTQPDGLEYSINVKSELMNDVTDRIKEICARLPVMPLIDGVDDVVEWCAAPKYSVRAETWGMQEGEGRQHYIYTNLRKYKIEIEYLSFDVRNKLRAFDSFSLDFFANIGDVSVQPNRSGLVYNDKTKNCLEKLYNTFMDDYVKVCQDNIENATSMYEARVLYCEIYRKIPWALQKNFEHLKWSGNKLTHNIDIDWDVNSSVKFMLLGRSDKRARGYGGDLKWTIKPEFRNSLHVQGDAIKRIIINDTEKYFSTYLFENLTLNGTDLIIKAPDEAGIKEALDKLGNPPADMIERMSEWTVPNRRRCRAHSKVKLKILQSYTWYETEVDWKDDTQEFYYIPMERHDLVSDHEWVLVQHLKSCIYLQLVPHIYGVPRTLKHIEKAKNWHRAEDKILEQLEAAWTQKKPLIADYLASNYSYSFEVDRVIHLARRMNKLGYTFHDRKYELIERLLSYEVDATASNWINVFSNILYKKLHGTEKKIVSEVVTLQQEYRADYGNIAEPFLSDIGPDGITDNNVHIYGPLLGFEKS